MQEIIDNTQLKKFGIVLIIGLVAIFGLLFPFLKDHPLPLWPYVTASILLVPTLFKPQYLNFIYKPWMKLGHYLGWINTRIILGVIFYVLITPMGLFMRLFGKDPMDRGYLNNVDSYRKKSTQQPPSHMEKPF
ncbi:MAG: sxtJ [Proteobacteria bacterium]|nr:sxtJ [Pseudomonadota bacterium]